MGFNLDMYNTCMYITYLALASLGVHFTVTL